MFARWTPQVWTLWREFLVVVLRDGEEVMSAVQDFAGRGWCAVSEFSPPHSITPRFSLNVAPRPPLHSAWLTQCTAHPFVLYIGYTRHLLDGSTLSTAPCPGWLRGPSWDGSCSASSRNQLHRRTPSNSRLGNKPCTESEGRNQRRTPSSQRRNQWRVSRRQRRKSTKSGNTTSRCINRTRCPSGRYRD